MDLTAAGPVSSAVRSLCADFNGFGLDLHRGLPSGGNTFISPLSIGAALAALLQGARGQTAAELARVLRLEGTAEDTARAMAELRGILTPRKTVEEAWNDRTEEFETAVRETFRLSLATGLLVEEAYPLHTAFCDALTEAFGAEFLSVTFANPEETADRVNTWVAGKTEDRITDLVSPDSLLPDMRLILASAVYFKARWADQFAEEVTRSKPFHLLPGAGTGSVEVPMMARPGTFLYWKSESAEVEALSIDYEERLSMLVVLPATGRFAEVEAGLSADMFARMQAGSEWTLVDLELPRFEMRFETELGDVLRRLGLQTAFDIATADLGGITPHPDGLVLSEAIHQAWLKVDEHGTEAAAATALMAVGAGIPEEEPPQPIPFVVGQAFLLLHPGAADGSSCCSWAASWIPRRSPPPTTRGRSMSSERSGPIAGVVLAAGNSTRMGRNKLLLELDGEPVIRSAVGRAIDAGLSPVIVVLGFEADRVREVLFGLMHQEVVNTEFEAGINSSVRLGIAAVPDQAIGAVVILPDMPFVTTSMLETLMARYRESDAPLVISRYGDVNAPPMLHGRELFPEFEEPDGEGCGKHIVRRHRDDAAVVEWDPAALTDLDVPEDYERVKARRRQLLD